MEKERGRIENLAKLRLLLSVEGIGIGKLLNLFTKFNSVDEIFHASVNSLTHVDNISLILANRIIKIKQNYSLVLEETISEVNKLKSINGNFLTLWDNDYPKLLKEIYSPPVLLYYIGNLDLFKTECIGVVGTRMPSAYGKMITEKIVKELISNNITIVSGLARGIDSTAHNATVANNGKTIAVIGSGLDVVYPPENLKLFNQIIQNGLILSEYPLGTKPDPQNFPKRNRIISGLSKGSLVIETKLNGGAMQTAHFALDQGREVFAVPGNIISPQSEGTNYLIQKGEAKLVTNAEDILCELNIKNSPAKITSKEELNLNMFEQKIFDVLNHLPKHIDEISNETTLNTSDCLINLLELEFKGLIKQLPGKVFIKNP